MKKLPLLPVFLIISIIKLNSQNNISVLKTNSLSLKPDVNLISSPKKTKTTKDDTNNYITDIKSTFYVEDTKIIYPNPAVDYVNINTIPNSLVSILDKNGVSIKSFKNTFGESFIDIRDLKKGTYTVRITEKESNKKTTTQLYVK